MSNVSVSAVVVKGIDYEVLKCFYASVKNKKHGIKTDLLSSM